MKLRNWLPVTVMALATSTVVNSQESGKKQTNRLLEEVVVTAQKREERLQDVPISIQAFSQEKMEALGIVSIQDIQLATPGFTVTNAAGFNITFMRGVGSDAFLPGVDSSVPFYLDSVPLLAIQGTSDTLGRIERVEVLKGPQGTLFGRNATGGAISIVTPDPDQEFYGDLKVEAGNYNMLNATAFVNIPITEAIAINASAFTNDRDNYLTNASTGNLMSLGSTGARIKARFDVTDLLSITLNGTKQKTSGNCALAFQNVKPALIFGGDLAPGKDPKFDREVTLDGDSGCQNESYVFGGVVDFSGEYFDSKLILARQNVTATRVDGPFDGIAFPLVDAHGAGRFGSSQFVDQDTAELQFLSNEGSPYAEYVEWATGFFYLKSLGGFDPIVFNVAPDLLSTLLPSVGGALSTPLNELLGVLNLPPILGEQGVQLGNYGLMKSESFSFYAQPTFHIGESVDLTTGVRYQRETRDLEGSRTSMLMADGSELVLPLPQGAEEQLTPEQVSVRTALQWRPFEMNDTQFYLSWARGWKNPTYNTVNLLGDTLGTMVALKAERVDTTELGVKTALFDERLQLNTALFYTEQRDPLSSNVSLTSGGIANFTNAGAARITGIDGDFLLTPLIEWNPGLVVTGAFSYLDAHYTDFKDGRGYTEDTGLGFGNGGANLPPRDFSGNRIPRVARWSYNFAVNQRLELNADNSIEIGADMSYSSDFSFLPQESDLASRDEVYLTNARITYFYVPWGLELAAFVNNIEDKLYVENVFVTDFGTSLMANDNPRLYGLRMKVTY